MNNNRVCGCFNVTVDDIIKAKSKGCKSVKEIINENCNSVRLYEYFRKNGNESLYKNGLRKIADGITSFEEVNKILFSLGEFENEF